jgi:predicted membrane protein (TIGR00267 family)
MVSEDNNEFQNHDGEGIIDRLHRLEEELILTGRYTVARAHVAEEIFDGILPILGIVLAGYIAAHMQESFLVFETTILAALGASIAHFISGFGGTYFAESAEGRQLIEQLRNSKESKLSKAVIVSIEHETTLLLSFLKGIVPAGAVLVTVSPMLMAIFGWIDYIGSFLVSIIVGLTILFILGLFLGRIAKTNIWINGLKTLMAGILTLLVLFVVTWVTGA